MPCLNPRGQAPRFKLPPKARPPRSRSTVIDADHAVLQRFGQTRKARLRSQHEKRPPAEFDIVSLANHIVLIAEAEQRAQPPKRFLRGADQTCCWSMSANTVARRKPRRAHALTAESGTFAPIVGGILQVLFVPCHRRSFDQRA